MCVCVCVCVCVLARSLVGHVLYCSILPPTPASLLHAWEQEAAANGIKKMNGTQINGRTVAVDWAVPKSEYLTMTAAATEENAEGAEDEVQSRGWVL